MMSFGRFSSALLGASALHAVCLLLQSPSYQAAWGWYMTVSGDAQFTCTQGSDIGCESTQVAGQENCATYTCSIQAKSGYTCSAASTTVMCRKTADASSTFSPPAGACISNETSATAYGMTVDSELYWSEDPGCTSATPAPTVAGQGETVAPTVVPAVGKAGKTVVGAASIVVAAAFF